MNNTEFCCDYQNKVIMIGESKVNWKLQFKTVQTGMDDSPFFASEPKNRLGKLQLSQYLSSQPWMFYISYICTNFIDIHIHMIGQAFSMPHSIRRMRRPISSFSILSEKERLEYKNNKRYYSCNQNICIARFYCGIMFRLSDKTTDHRRFTV